MSSTVNQKSRYGVVSVHDVMPETLARVSETIKRLDRMGICPATLLITPGRQWSKKDIFQLKAFLESGHHMAGHGWHHRSSRLSSRWHRLHSLIISRNEAEHLSLSSDKIFDLIFRSYHWFGDTGFPRPSLYVPPAWAMGLSNRRQLKKLPFRLYEMQSGVYDSEGDIFRILPVTGYMADTPARVEILKMINRVMTNKFLRRLPLRIAIHPDDFSLGLSDDLMRHLMQSSHFLGYSDIFNLQWAGFTRRAD